jgi:ADP-ribose pyrophosphatase
MPFDRWKVVQSRYLVHNRWLRLRADTCQLPGESLIEEYYVSEYPPWVIVVALTEDQQVVLVRQYRHGIGRAILEIPGGTTDEGDVSMEAAVRRELLEETGYGGGIFEELGRISANPANQDNLVYCFLATGVERIAEPHLDATEQIEVVLMPLREMVRRAQASEFLQSLHVSALFFALAKLGYLKEIH